MGAVFVSYITTRGGAYKTRKFLIRLDKNQIDSTETKNDQRLFTADQLVHQSPSRGLRN
jgi:hypothetical protein